MTTKIIANVSGRTFKMGRRAPIAPAPKLMLGNYLLRALPKAPRECDYSAKAALVLGQMFANDRLGDCTAAAAFHIAGLMLQNAGESASFTDAEIVDFYSATGHYVPGDDKTDNGASIHDVLNYWRSNGLIANGSNKILAYLGVNARDDEEIKAALWLFENVYFGVNLPDAWVHPSPIASGFVWGSVGVPNKDNGHAFAGCGYDPVGVTISTWGMLGTLTWDAVSRYACHENHGELYVVLSHDSIARADQKTRLGLDMQHLMFDFRRLHSDLP